MTENSRWQAEPPGEEHVGTFWWRHDYEDDETMVGIVARDGSNYGPPGGALCWYSHGRSQRLDGVYGPVIWNGPLQAPPLVIGGSS